MSKEVTREEMLACLNCIDGSNEPFRCPRSCRDSADAIRKLIVEHEKLMAKVGGWKDRIATLLNDESGDNFFRVIEARIVLLEEIRDYTYGGEEKP